MQAQKWTEVRSKDEEIENAWALREKMDLIHNMWGQMDGYDFLWDVMLQYFISF